MANFFYCRLYLSSVDIGYPISNFQGSNYLQSNANGEITFFLSQGLTNIVKNCGPHSSAIELEQVTQS